ncbi:flagellar transcriptional regulator FlhD [Salinisphaera sp. Q1T1-3]|uniref:flagellar transcriptional regulator FlhD n=1 Tax=Salinisphaera sp. Q1T1-3 TaxID=2321229 RepID=UPI000E7186A6|nr:flagellar transcriptional regulator FlhD [Salinisphaera sp. Q1T1-3]RJS95191.1 flagellar transcriptional regulator FlhD [Salinisphaera sp. Q1T1-3]
MKLEQLLEDIRQVNLSYLLLMQRLIGADRETAMFRLKIDDEMADLLTSVSVTELASLARCNQLLCHFSLEDADQLDSLIRATANEDMRQVHAAILLGSNERRAANDRRREDRRQGDRRLQDDGPPNGVERRETERRSGEDRRETARRATDHENTTSPEPHEAGRNNE